MLAPQLVVTDTGRMIHLSTPWRSHTDQPVHAACRTLPWRSSAHYLPWNEWDDRPVCTACITEWRRWNDLTTRWANEMLNTIERDGPMAWQGVTPPEPPENRSDSGTLTTP